MERLSEHFVYDELMNDPNYLDFVKKEMSRGLVDSFIHYSENRGKDREAQRFSKEMAKNDFCSYGERIEQEEE